jgi:phage/plasmid primase-like uncharacterized protein
LHEKYPDKPIVIAGDDDRHLELVQGVNPGRSKALAAAKAVGGRAVFPVFAKGENTYPDDLPPITSQAFRDHEIAKRRLEAVEKEPEKMRLSEQETTDLKRVLLSDAQLNAYQKMKAHTDFNDLDVRSHLGREGLRRQAMAAVKPTRNQVEQQEKQDKRQEQIRQERRPRRAIKMA